MNRLTITTNSELYSTVRELSRSLRNAGEEQLAAELEDALLISTLPGEILGETRAQLQRLTEARSYQQVDFRKKVKEAVDYITSAVDPCS